MALSRRAFLGAGAAAAVAGAGLAALGSTTGRRALLRRLVEGLPDAPPAPLGQLTRASLGGFLAVYLPPSSARPSAIARTVAWADAESARAGGFGQALGEGLDALAGEPGRALFARGSEAARRDALSSRFLSTGPRHYLTPGGRAYLRFRHYVLPALLAEHFAGAAGWATVGYETFPGRCGAPRAYTEALT